MHKVNTRDIAPEPWTLPKGKFASALLDYRDGEE